MCDPIDDPDLYVRVARENGLKILFVIDTHLHADHVSGGRRLAEITGAEYVLHEGAEAKYAFRQVRDGEALDLGNVKMRVLHTPGHTPEHLSLLVTDHSRGPEPWFVLTGHTLMVGDVGRTELATAPEVGAAQLFQTIHRLKELPEYLEILPGAYAGSVCGRSLSGKAVSTIGFERRFNRAFQIDTLEAFIEFMLQNIPMPPPNAAQIRARNQGLAG